MREISEAELKTILDNHGKWLRCEEGGECADLSSADLRSADLSSADLRSANLSFADLRFANLRFADFRPADLVIFQCQRHQAFYTSDGSLRIGCHVMPVTEWVIGYREIGKAEGYTDDQLEMYGGFIEMCMKQFTRLNPPPPHEKE